MEKDNEKIERVEDKSACAGSAKLPETWIGCLLYIFRWKRRQKMVCKATISMGRKVTEFELFGDELIPPNELC